MRIRFLVGLSLLAVVLAACDSGDAELTPGSTLITGGGGEATTSTTVGPGPDDTTSATPTTLVGQPVDGFEVFATFPNDNGVSQHIVIPEGAYTDVDLENFVFDLLESNPNLFGAEIFDDAGAAAAFVVPEESRSDAQDASLDRHHFVTLVGRDSYEFRGPFAEFPGGAIGS